jgi:hypothetical protein
MSNKSDDQQTTDNITAKADRAGYIRISGNRNIGWRASIVNAKGHGLWFSGACLDSRDAAVVHAVHYAIAQSIKLVPPAGLDFKTGDTGV